MSSSMKSNTCTSKSSSNDKKSTDPVKSNQVSRGSSAPYPLKLTRKYGVEILEQCKLVSNLRAMVEAKEAIPAFRGRDYPTSLTIPHGGFQFTDTKESIVLQNTMRSLFGDKHYTFRLSTALNMSSSGAGITNSTISNSALTSEPDFVSLSAIFNEFYVRGFTVKWRPASRYQYPLGGTSTLSVANLPLGKADLQHGQTAYTALSLMTTNFRFRFHSTGDPFTARWINTDPEDGTLVTTSGATQSWSSVGNVANYTGTLQFLTPSAPPALPFSQVLGTFAVHWDVVFRVRV